MLRERATSCSGRHLDDAWWQFEQGLANLSPAMELGGEGRCIWPIGQHCTSACCWGLKCSLCGSFRVVAAVKDPGCRVEGKVPLLLLSYLVAGEKSHVADICAFAAASGRCLSGSLGVVTTS